MNGGERIGVCNILSRSYFSPLLQLFFFADGFFMDAVFGGG